MSSRRLVLLAFAALGLYVGYLAGQQLGLLTAVYRQIERHAPEVIEIGRTIRDLPRLARDLRSGVARQPECPAPRIQLIRTAPRPPRATAPSPAGKAAIVTAPAGTTETHPGHWPRDPFAKH